MDAETVITSVESKKEQTSGILLFLSYLLLEQLITLIGLYFLLLVQR